MSLGSFETSANWRPSSRGLNVRLRGRPPEGSSGGYELTAGCTEAHDGQERLHLARHAVPVAACLGRAARVGVALDQSSVSAPSRSCSCCTHHRACAKKMPSDGGIEGMQALCVCYTDTARASQAAAAASVIFVHKVLASLVAAPIARAAQLGQRELWAWYVCSARC